MITRCTSTHSTNSPRTEAEALLRPCVDADRWIHELISARPFATRDELTSYALNGITPFDPQELDAALAQAPPASVNVPRVKAKKQIFLVVSRPR
ncbi:2-oxo-4-hydroxy-4-carboxy-5-ureidoimidazoline decarboxylase [Glutamicibacter halophytocola]|uniref:2-oxo-4-hydroxy-4-carboxy-5-ureidoimidazoline decarboxylase n=1 Tax=Glutamicibacter halophytocola TaxID=1933880 RepID=UPI003219860E